MKKKGPFRRVIRSIMVVAVMFVWVAGTVPAYGNTNATGQQNTNSSDDLTTGYSSSQAQHLSDLGLSTTQPSRTNSAGHVINKKTDTPLGPNMLVENQTFQVAGAGLYVAGDPYDIYDLSSQQKASGAVLNSLLLAGSSDVTSEVLNNHTLLNTSSGSTSDWYDAPKAMVGADLDGSGKDDLVTVALPYNSKNKTCSFEVTVTSYDGTGVSRTGSRVLQYDMIPPLPWDNSHVSPIHVAAGDFDHDTSGKDEIAVTVGNTLYVYSIGATPVGSSSLAISATLLWGAVYSTSDTSKDWPEMDLVAADANGDGYKDLLVTTGSYDGGADGNIPQLLIYSDTPATPLPGGGFEHPPEPVAKIPLSLSKDEAFVAPNVAVGDIFGNGIKDIVIAGKTELNGKINHDQASLTYITYDPTTESYDNSLQNGLYPLSISSNDHNGRYIDYHGMAGLAIVSLDGPVGAQYVVSGDHVFRYDSSSVSFVDQNVDVSAGDTTYMLNIAAGNFIGGTTLKEQIAMLYTGSSGTYLTFIGEANPDNTDISSSTVKLDNAKYPAICAPDILNNGIKYTYDKSEFTFTDPTVIAVMAATPYYEGIPYAAAQGNVGTSFGTGSGSESATTNGLEVSEGIKVGFKQDISILIKVGEAECTAQLVGSLTADWTNSKSVEKTISYSNYVGNADKSTDSVVVAVVPEDIYFYKVADETGSDTTEMNIAIPYAPETNIMPVADYNSIITKDNVPNAPYINTKRVLDGAQPGNPASYPGSVNVTPALSNIKSSNDSPSVITGSDFIGCGRGNNAAQQSINESTSSSTSVGGSITLNEDVEGDVLGVVFGTSASMGYTHSTENTTSNSVTFEGSVAGVPDGNAYDQYQFRWELVVYKYNLKAGDSTQTIDVISYLVRPLTQPLPPATPQNLKVETITPRAATLEWNPVYNSSYPVGYYVLRSSTIDGSYTIVKTIPPGDVQGKGPVTCKDTSLRPDRTYYYRVKGYDGSPAVAGRPTGPVEVQTPSELTMKVDFQVGAKNHATVLVANEPLVAKALIKNNRNRSEDAIFIVALYDANGAMVSESHKAVSVGPKGVCITQAGFTLPEDVTNATVAAFLWNGSDLESSPLVPLSNVVEITSR